MPTVASVSYTHLDVYKRQVRIVLDPAQMHEVQPGDVLVADMTDPNWEPVMLSLIHI